MACVCVCVCVYVCVCVCVRGGRGGSVGAWDCVLFVGVGVWLCVGVMALRCNTLYYTSTFVRNRIPNTHINDHI